MELNYDTYKALGEAQQAVDLLGLESSLVSVNSKNAKNFLSALLSDSSQSAYRRKKSLELIAQLVFLNKTRIEAIVDKILDVENSDELFFVLSAIKLSHRFYYQSKEGILAWLDKLTLDNNIDIRSEAFYSRGRILFSEALSANNTSDFCKLIIQAESDFEKSVSEIENRIDAKLFGEISKFLLTAKALQQDNVDVIYKSIKTDLWQYGFYSVKNGEIASIVNLVDSLAVVKRLLQTEPDNWLDFKNEFNEILIQLHQLEALAICNEVEITKWNSGNIRDIQRHIVENILTTSFQHHISKLNRLLNENHINSIKDKEVINDIMNLITNLEKDKKKDETALADILARLHNSFPNIPLATIRYDLWGLDVLEIDSIIKLFSKYLTASNSNIVAIKTGFPQGDEILNIIGNELLQLLPRFPLEKRIEFLLVLRDVLNYFINASQGSKSKFEFLFKSDAHEKELQDSLLTYLHATERAGKYTSEVRDYADGGRVDINYNSAEMQFPIELKRSFETLDWETVCNKYIGQAQTYAYTRDQLAIFMVLDLSPKEAVKPEANLRDLFKILHLPPRQSIEIQHPNYVVALILPGNKYLPSQRSKY